MRYLDAELVEIYKRVLGYNATMYMSRYSQIIFVNWFDRASGEFRISGNGETGRLRTVAVKITRSGLQLRRMT